MSMTDSTAMRACPQFLKCSAPDCPLDPHYLQRGPRQPGEPTCRAQKPTRLRAAAQGVTRFGGLTSREYAGKARWEALSPEEQEAARARASRLVRRSEQAVGADGA
jgi:hypothetical protein